MPQSTKPTLSEAIASVLETLTPREREVIMHRFEVGGAEFKTLRELGEKYGVKGEPIRQTEAKALRKLKHHSRRNVLEAYLDTYPEGLYKIPRIGKTAIEIENERHYISMMWQARLDAFQTHWLINWTDKSICIAQTDHRCMIKSFQHYRYQDIQIDSLLDHYNKVLEDASKHPDTIQLNKHNKTEWQEKSSGFKIEEVFDDPETRFTMRVAGLTNRKGD